MFTDQELKARALMQWANHIETGTIILSKDDALARGKQVNKLDEAQVRLVERMRSLARDELSKGSVGR